MPLDSFDTPFSSLPACPMHVKLMLHVNLCLYKLYKYIYMCIFASTCGQPHISAERSFIPQSLSAVALSHFGVKAGWGAGLIPGPKLQGLPVFFDVVRVFPVLCYLSDNVFCVCVVFVVLCRSVCWVCLSDVFPYLLQALLCPFVFWSA